MSCVAPETGPTPAAAGPRPGYDPALFARVRRAENRHFWFRHRNEVIARVVRRLRRHWSAESRVLEVGCGTGNTLRVLEQHARPARVIGLDLYDEGLDYARRSVGCELVRGDLRDIPVPGAFDLIAAFDVVEHLDDDRAVLAGFRRRLVPGGRVLLTVPALMSLWSYFDEAACHRRRYTAATLRGTLAAAGFRVETLTYFMAPLVPVVWAARRAAAARGRVRKADAAAMAADEFRVVPGVNLAFRAVLAVERAALAVGFRPPVGSSLLAVAVAD